MAAKVIKTFSLAELKDKHMGKIGTKDRKKYEYKLSMEVLEKRLKVVRQNE